jgi:hypothetical protein
MKEIYDLKHLQALKKLAEYDGYLIEMARKNYPSYYKSKETHSEIKGFTLIQTYPGCSKPVGHFEPYTSGEFINYPHIWKPVYHKQVEREKKINEILGEKD